MTKATRILDEEHGWIRLLLDCLARLVEGIRSQGEFDAKAATELQSLFEHFVDDQHQGKEEEGLFPKILQRVKDLQAEHGQERAHLERMRYSLFNATLGDPSGREEFAKEAEAYIDLQRHHMAQERLGLLPLARQVLTEDDEREVLAAFRRVEAEGPGHAEVEQRVRRLCDALGVPFQEDADVDEVLPAPAS